MRKAIATLAVITVMTLVSTALQANFTMFDMAKDSMYIVRGEYTGLERTQMGDRLTLRCDVIIKGDLLIGQEIKIEPFEPAPADAALGREVIACFNLIDQKAMTYAYFNHPFAWRSFIFEDSDMDSAPNGLEKNEQALRNFLAINAPHEAEIYAEWMKRVERQDMGYEGKFAKSLIDEWKAELLKQLTWSGTRAAFDAAKALCEHDLFKGQLTVAELQLIGAHVPQSAAGTLERSYELELIRNENSAHPDFATQMMMLREETSEACVGKLSNLMLAVEDRQQVLETVGTLADNRNEPAQARINALQILQALKDPEGLLYVHAALLGELEAPDTNKDVMRRGLSALRSTPDASSAPVLDTLINSEYVSSSWELTQRAWVAYSMIDTTDTNAAVRAKFNAAETQGLKFFFQKLLPENKIIRKLMIIHKED
ncbi:MAG: hypothetical protein H6839_05560 [Planctomycetes bacterium]|nr:hypothetical protein [Planctomycetota bacterium]